MASLAPRASVAAPAALLAHLRCRAACAAQAACRGTAKLTGCLPDIPVNRQRVEQLVPQAAAAAAAAEPALQSSAGVDPASLIGFTVVDLTHKNRPIGVIEDVLSMAETGLAQPLLHVCAPASNLEQTEGMPREEHLIPFVSEIVPSIDVAAEVVYASPPSGLLDLGRQHLLLATIQRELEPFTHPPPLSLLSRMGLRIMPTAAQLLAAGRRDLVADIKRAGGFLDVAQALGLRSQRKPAGFWDDEANLDEELTLFVAAHWTSFKEPESRQPYWYNQITHRISWEEPLLPERIEIDDEGGYILTEAEEDRVMPSRSAVCAAGRYDLHHAILHHGGYTAAAELLNRRPAWPPSQHLNSLPALRQALREFVVETELPTGRMPTSSQLVNAGRGDLLQAIVHRGGFAATAAALGWASQRRQRRAWVDAEAVAAELRQFILHTQFAAAAGSEARQRRGSARSGPSEGADVASLPPDARMPTHRELASAGRHDLKYALQQHRTGHIAALLGIQLDRRGAHNRRWAARGATGASVGAQQLTHPTSEALPP